MTDPNIYQGPGGGGTHHSLVNVVAEGVDNIGTPVTGATLTAVLASLVVSGQGAFFPTGTYNITTSPTIPAGLVMRFGAANVVFTGAGSAVLAGMQAQALVSTQNGPPFAASPTTYTAFAAADQTQPPFTFSTYAAIFNATWDNLMFWGWNGNLNVNGPSMRDGNESNYEVHPGVHVFERYIEAHTDSTFNPGTFYRPFYCNFNHATAEGGTVIAHGFGNTVNDFIYFQNAEQTATYASFSPVAGGGLSLGVLTIPLAILASAVTATTGNVGWTTSGFFNQIGPLDFHDIDTTHWRDSAANALGSLGIAIGPGASAALQWQVPVGGQGFPFRWTYDTVATLLHGAGGTITPSATVQTRKELAISDTGLTNNATVYMFSASDLGIAAQPWEWTIDLTGVNFGVGKTVTFTTGTGAKNVTVAAPGIIKLHTDGVGTLYALTYV